MANVSLPQRSDDAETPCLAAAIAYAAKGWRIVPVHHALQSGACSCSKGASCRTPGKHPRIAKWTELASRDEAKIRAWWKKWPDASVGIATGNELVALDFDAKSGGLDTLDHLKQEGDLGNPLIVETGGGGRQLYYAPTKDLRTGTNVLPGLDIRADGGLVVAPPSVHASGKAYAFSFDSFDGDAEDLNKLRDPGPMPEWVLRRLDEAQGGTRAKGESVSLRRALTEVERRELIPILREALKCVPADDRTIWLQIGMALHALGDDGFELWAEWSRVSTKFDVEDQQRTWDSFGKRIGASSITVGTLFFLAREHGFTGAIPGTVPTEPVAIVVSRLSWADSKATFALHIDGVSVRTTRLSVTSRQSRTTAAKDLWEAVPKDRDTAEQLRSLFDAAWAKAEQFANRVLNRPEPKATPDNDGLDGSDLSPAKIEEAKQKAVQLRDQDCVRRTSALSDEERRRAVALGSRPELLSQLMNATDLLGHVGENQNAAVLVLVYASCRLWKPLHVLILGLSSAGKSHLCATVAKLFPPEWVLSLTEMTPKFLAYLKPFEIAGKIIVLGERPLGDEEQVAVRTKFMREMIEQGYTTHGTVESDGTRYEATQKLVLGPIASSETTTKSGICAEDQNRRVTLESDRSEEQTDLILTRQAAVHMGEHEALSPQELSDIHNLFRLLKRPKAIEVPFAGMLASIFPKHLIEVRRIFLQVLTLISVHAHLNQMQRKARDESGQQLPWDHRDHGGQTLEADPRDYEAIVKIVNPILGRALREKLSAGDKELFEQVQQLVASRGREVVVQCDFTTPQICTYIHATTRREPEPSNIRKKLGTLESHGLVKLTRPGSGRYDPNVYTLLKVTGTPDDEGWQLPETYAELWAQAKGPEHLSPQAFADEDWAAA